ncbi:MAG: hypothetical protein WBM54_15225 [Woeseia sp.]
MIGRIGLVLFTCTLLVACSDKSASADKRLPALHALAEFTVSGVSAGAYLAGQLHVAYSADIGGAGLVAGGPWGCANGSMQRALGACSTGSGIDVAALVQQLGALAGDNLIDDPANLQDDRVYVFRGTQDVLVGAAVASAAADFYRAAAPTANIAVVMDVPATHGWPTLANGAPCGEFKKPWITACDYDLAGNMLQQLLGPLAEPTADPVQLTRFSQARYEASSLADEGLLYVPASCQEGERCRVHVFLHGCNQALGQVGAVLAEQSGLLRWAASNKLIVLFPQAKASSLAPMNPLACWDWWGYSGSDYLHKEAAQLQAIRAMVARLQSSE